MKQLCLSLLLSLSLITPAYANPVIDFMGGLGGTITHLPPVLIGENINIATVQLIDTNLNAGAYAVQNGLLNFVTAGPQGTFSITGAIADLGIAMQTLFTGTFASHLLSTVGPFGFFQAAGFNGHAPALLLAAGEPPSQHFASSTMILTMDPWTPGGVHQVFSTDVATLPTPEPASLVLLASVLIALGFMNWRRG